MTQHPSQRVGHSSSVSYHAPGEWGECDDCEYMWARPSYEMPDGDDICGRCYGERKGYFES